MTSVKYEHIYSFHFKGAKHILQSFANSVDKDHGRIGNRELRVVSDIEWLPQKRIWKKLECIIEVRCTREFVNGKPSQSATRLYIASRKSTASKSIKWVRQHWG